MTEDERRTLMQVRTLLDQWGQCLCLGFCPSCLDRIAIIGERIDDLLDSEADGTTANRG